MTDPKWTRIEEVFNQIVELAPDEQSLALDQECAGDTELRAAVEKLLRSHEQDLSRVRKVVDRAVATDPASEDRGGEQVGPYALIRPLGEGGMGAVYLARRSDDVHGADVAVKILKGASVGGDGARRFRAERHILAELNHPGVARLLDGGATDDGAPYLVMEYVDGTPIDDYCVRKSLTVRATLELFRRVCDAVQYAHGRLVVHRDLKPANILVTEDGGPKLLDFGIAKLLEGGSSGREADLTRTGFRPMTPNYASPEQVRGEVIGTSTDVYALGVVLYELLTGVLPYPSHSGANRELEDAILDRTPTAPSVALTEVHTAQSTSGDGRGGTARHLRGDLDTIVLRALQKDPARRYASVEQLSEDLGRHLSGLPVRARPDTLTYRAGKFVQRNRGGVLSGAMAFLVISLLAASSAFQSVQLKSERDALTVERDRAAAVSDFMIGVFRSSDPNASPGVDITAREILANGGRQVREDLSGDPPAQAAVMSAIGEVYRSLGVYDSAAVILTEAVDRTRVHFGEASLEFASALLDLGSVLRRQDRFDEAEDAILTAREIRLATLGTDDVGTGEAWNNLGTLYENMSQYDLAAEAHLEGLRIRSAALGENHVLTATSLSNLSSTYIDLGRFDEAIAMGQRSLAARRALYGATHSNLAVSLNNLASAYEYAGNYEAALPLYRESREVRDRLYPPGHPSILTALNNLGNLYLRLNRYDESRELLMQAAAGSRLRQDRYRLARTLVNLGAVTARTGRFEEAQHILHESIALFAEVQGPDSPMVAYALGVLSDAQIGIGDERSAEASLGKAIRIQRASLGATDPNLLSNVSDLGGLLVTQGRLDEAEPLVREAFEAANTSLDPSHPLRILFALEMAALKVAQGSLEEAKLILEQAEASAIEARGSEDPSAVTARRMLDTHFGLGKSRNE